MPEDQSPLYEFSEGELTITREQALCAAGYPADAVPARRVEESIVQAEKTLRGLMRPRAAVRFAELVFRDGADPGFGTDGGPAFHSRLITKPLSAGRAWAFFVVTIGGRASEISGKTSERDFLLSYLLDALASLFAERLADLLQERLGAEAAKKGWATGWRFSPGYCDWELKENRDLLSVLTAERIGIRLTGGGMMVPEKSVSGVMGFGLPGSGVEKSPCASCGNKKCPHRRGARKN